MDKDVANIEEELKRLSVIANALNRSLVLPPIHCTSGKHKYCNLCTFDSPHCFSSTISSFKQPVKESVFFTNKKVPQIIVEEDRHNPILSFEQNCKNNTSYKSSFPAHAENSNEIWCIPCEGRVDSCIISEGVTREWRVLKVFSLQ